MVLLVTYGVLLTILLVTIVASFQQHLPAATRIAQIASGVGLTAAFLQLLARNSLTVYFWLRRLRLRFSPSAVTRWSFHARFDGSFAGSAVADLVARLKDRHLFAYSVRVERATDRDTLVTIDDSLPVHIAAEPRHLSADDQGHVTLVSNVVELPYRYSIQKIEKLVIPLIILSKTELRPDSSSYELDVQFRAGNPFFDLYIAHLRPSQIGDFKVVLNLDTSYSPARKERVVISRQNLHITAATTDGFRKLAEDFILLSPDVKEMVAGARDA